MSATTVLDLQGEVQAFAIPNLNVEGTVTRSLMPVAADSTKPIKDYIFDVKCRVASAYYDFIIYKSGTIWQSRYLYVRNVHGYVLSIHTFVMEAKTETKLFEMAIEALTMFVDNGVLLTESVRDLQAGDRHVDDE